MRECVGVRRKTESGDKSTENYCIDANGEDAREAADCHECGERANDHVPGEYVRVDNGEKCGRHGTANHYRLQHGAVFDRWLTELTALICMAVMSISHAIAGDRTVMSMHRRGSANCIISAISLLG